MILGLRRVGWQRSIWLLEFDDCSTLGGILQQIECGSDHPAVRETIPGWSYGSAHGMTGHNGAGIPHLFGHMAKRPHQHRDGGYARFLCSSCDVSDRHVTDRSDRNQE